MRAVLASPIAASRVEENSVVRMLLSSPTAAQRPPRQAAAQPAAAAMPQLHVRPPPPQPQTRHFSAFDMLASPSAFSDDGSIGDEDEAFLRARFGDGGGDAACEWVCARAAMCVARRRELHTSPTRCIEDMITRAAAHPPTACELARCCSDADCDVVAVMQTHTRTP
jgi:hypothetical protein